MNRLKFRQGSFHRTTEADFRDTFNVRKDELKHIIHGSFRKLDYLDVQNAGDISVLAVVTDKGGELEEQKEINDGADFVNLDNFSVVFVANGLQINQDSFDACQSVRMLIIGNECESNIQSMELINMRNLERVEIGSNCFNNVTALRVENCPKLRRLFIGDGSFKIIRECVIENNEELLELQLGGNKGVSIESDEKKSSDTTSETIGEKKPAKIETGKKTSVKPKKEGEKEDHEEQRILRLASWYHSYTIMNRPSRVEESTAWR